MKELMLGNKAIARGLYEAGVAVASSYPGTPSTETTEEAAKFEEIYCEWAPNEKVAMETAFGASRAGKRSYCAMKHVGLNVAADPLFTMSYTGVNAGMVILVADDPGMHSSQNEQDSRHYAIAAKMPMLEPADSQEAKDFIIEAYDISEQFDTPVLIKMCTRVAHSQSVVETGERIEVPVKPYVKDAGKYVMVPANAKRRHPIVEERTQKLIAFAEESSLNRVEEGSDTSMGIITSSTSYQYVKEVFGDKYPVLKIGLINPLPVQKIKDFAAKVGKLVVVEELDPIIETHCKTLGLEVTGKDVFPLIDEFSQGLIAAKLGLPEKPACKPIEGLPGRPPAMCAGCPHRGMFYVLSKLKLTVMADIGCYTLGATPPLCAIDTTECMGASISSLHGFNKALGADAEKKTVAVIGDSTFMHSGMTGHQQNPTTGFNLRGDPAGKIDLEALVRAMGINRVRVVDPYNLAEAEAAVKEELAAEEPSVIISRRPCALLKKVKRGEPIQVNADKCKSCKACMKLGCPAISFKDGHAHVDTTQCFGCKVCSELCKFGAFEDLNGEAITW